MAQAGKGKLNYRCPQCFGRDIDMDLLFDCEKGEYYCTRCNFVGDEQRVLQYNEQNKTRYRRLKQRVVDFGEDNEPPKFKQHKAGEQ